MDAVWYKCFLFVLFGLKCEGKTINFRQTFLPAVCESLLSNEQEALMDDVWLVIASLQNIFSTCNWRGLGENEAFK